MTIETARFHAGSSTRPKKRFWFRIRCLALLCLGVLNTQCLFSQTSSPNAMAPEALRQIDLEKKLAARGNAMFKDTPLSEVILRLSNEWGVNIVLGSQIDGIVTGTYVDEPLAKILESLLTANNYSYRKIGSSLVIVSASENGLDKPSLAVEIIDAPAGTEDMEELVQALKLQMGPDGNIQPISSSGKLAIQDTPDRILAVKDMLERIAPTSRTVESPVALGSDQPNNSTAPQASTTGALEAFTRAIHLRPQFVAAAKLKEPMSLILGEGAVVAMDDAIVVIGEQSLHARARALLTQLDIPSPQVRITGYIYDVDHGEFERLGVDWNQRIMSQTVDANGIPRNLGYSGSGLLTANAASQPAQTIASASSGSSTATAAAETVAAATGGQFLFRTLSNRFEVQALIQAIEKTEGSQLLADPHVTVKDQTQASLGIVTKIPVQSLTQTSAGGDIGSTSFEEAGIKLTVTPFVSNDGTIELTVEPEFSVLAGFSNGNPIIDSRRAKTVVRVANGQALVIGGLRSKTTVETIKGIPHLMNIKWLGRLFQMHDTDIRDSELLVLIMPEIVGWQGGLEREEHALQIAREKLSCIPPACTSPFLPDCKDKNCPQHHPRPRAHNGMQDNGLIGGIDDVYVRPNAPAYVLEDIAPPPAPQDPRQ